MRFFIIGELVFYPFISFHFFFFLFSLFSFLFGVPVLGFWPLGGGYIVRLYVRWKFILFLVNCLCWCPPKMTLLPHAMVCEGVKSTVRLGYYRLRDTGVAPEYQTATST